MGDEFDDVPALDGANADDQQGLLTALDAMLDHLKNKVAMPAAEFYALDTEAKQRAFTVSGVADLDLVSDVWTAIEKAVEDGETLEDFRARVAEGLTSAWGADEPWRLENLFRTNLQTAYSAGRQAENAQVKDTHPFIRFDVVDDERTSDLCSALIDVVVSADSDFAASHQPPLHHGCVVGSTVVEGRVLGALRTFYSGELIKLKTRSGHQLSLTPNHPVLTDRGFKPAGLLRVGENAVRYAVDVEPVLDVPEDEQNAPTTIEEVFRALGLVWTQRTVELRALDLHGDAACTDGQVDVVGAVVELLDAREAQRPKPGGEGVLVQTATGTPGATRPGGLHLLSDAPHPSGGRTPSSGELAPDSSATLLEPRPLDPLLFGSASKSLACRLHSIAHGLGVALELLPDSDGRQTGHVGRDDGLIVQGELRLPGRAPLGEDLAPLARFEPGPPKPEIFTGGSQGDSTRGEGLPEGSRSDLRFMAELRDSLPGQVASDEIVEIERLDFAGHVYDLQTAGGWYVAGGLCISNCRTDAVAITADEADELGVVEDHEAPDVEADDGFGGAMTQWVPDLSSRPPEMASIYELKLLQD